MTGYQDSKLQICLFSNAVARRWPDVVTNSLDPGWVPTKMGGAGASGDIGAAVKTYLMLIKGESNSTGKHFYSSAEKAVKAEALDTTKQEKLLEIYEKITGVKLPAS